MSYFGLLKASIVLGFIGFDIEVLLGFSLSRAFLSKNALFISFLFYLFAALSFYEL
jgi:hypothetical protein